MNAATRMAWRQAVIRHLGITVLFGAIVLAGAGIGIVRSAQATTRRTAATMSATITSTVLERLATADYSKAGGFHRERTLQTLERLLHSGTLFRVKLWLIQGGTARIVVSDQPQLEGLTRTADGPLTPPSHLRAGQATSVWTVPEDGEHRFEQGGRADLLEVFTTFSDTGGNLLSLETYLSVNVGAAGWDAARDQLPLMALAVLVVSAAAFPLTVAAARRSRRLAAERYALVSLAVEAADRQRHQLAKLLHDGPIQNLAAAHVALSVDRPVATVGPILRATIAELRALTSGLVPHPPVKDLATDLPRLLCHEVPENVALNVGLPAAPDPANAGPHLALIVQGALELVRNAVRHGRPSWISVDITAGGGCVVLTVSDDGSGFDPGRPAPEGHIGLALLHHAAASVEGTLSLTSAPGAGCAATLCLPLPQRSGPRQRP